MGSIDFRGEIIEINPGLRFIWERFPYIRPFIGVWPSIIWARFEGESWGITVWDSNWTLGFWTGGGVYVTLAKHLNLGIKGKYSYSKVNLFSMNADAGGWHLAGLVGFHW